MDSEYVPHSACYQIQTSVQVLAHRGCWHQRDERNTLTALTKGLAQNYGIETDVRDMGGTLVISHDPPGAKSLPLESLFAEYSRMQVSSYLALNIKCDGLAESLSRLLEQYDIRRYFVFDMSIPDTLSYLRRGLRVFARQSEIESHISLYEECQGVWLDAFHHDWYSEDTLIQHIDNGKQIAVVSPELHGRSPEKVWRLVQNLPEEYARNTLICTDTPGLF